MFLLSSLKYSLLVLFFGIHMINNPNCNLVDSSATAMPMLKKGRLMSAWLHIRLALVFRSKIRPIGENNFFSGFMQRWWKLDCWIQTFLLVKDVARVEFPVPASQTGQGSLFLLGREPSVFSCAETARMPLSLWHLSLPKRVCFCFPSARAFSELN